MLPAVVDAVGVVCAIWLFSTTKSTGTCHAHQIHGLVEQTFSQSSIADKHPHDSGIPTDLERQSVTGANGRQAAQHPIAVKAPNGDVLASTPPSTHTAFTPHDLRKQSGDVRGVGEEMAVISVIGKHHIRGIVECPDNGHLTKLLANGRVRRSGNQPLLKQRQDESFRLANEVTKRKESLRLQWQDRLHVQYHGSEPPRNAPSSVIIGASSGVGGTGFFE